MALTRAALVAHLPVVMFDLTMSLVLIGLVVSATRRRSVPLAIGGLAAMWAAALPPIHDRSKDDVAWHMVQHLLLTMVAALLIGWALADSVTRGSSLTRWLRRRLLAPWAPIAAAVVHTATVVVWHLPRPYDNAVASSPLHILQHAMLFASALWFWTAAAHHARRRAAPGVVVGLFVVATGGAALGVFLMFLDRPIYDIVGHASEQQLAGALMAGGGGIVTGFMVMYVLVNLVRRASDGRQVVQARFPAAPGLLVVIVSAGILGSLRTDEPASARSATPLADPQVEAGAFLYGRDCAWCHGIDGQGTDHAASLDGLGAAGIDYVLTTGRMPIREPSSTIRRSSTHYTADEISALVAYAETLIDGPGVPDVDIDNADVAQGGKVYRRSCASCHGATGIGGAIAFDELTPSVLNATPAQTAEAMLVGPGTMPSFERLEDQVDDVAAYVDLLQDPPGHGLALPGDRVTEGLVAWLVGIGTLVIGARLIGSRS